MALLYSKESIMKKKKFNVGFEIEYSFGTEKITIGVEADNEREAVVMAMGEFMECYYEKSI